MDNENELKSALGHATSAGVRVVGLRITSYAVGLFASILLARGLGPVGRGLYAYPVALFGIVMAIGHFGLEFAQINMAGRGHELRRMWANATVFSVVAAAVCWAGVCAVILIIPRVGGGLPALWIAIPLGQLPFVLMSGYWTGLLQLDGRLVVTAWMAWLGVALQAGAVGVLYLAHQLTPFRVLVLQWPMTGLSWLMLLRACHQAGLVSLRLDPALLRRSVAFGMRVWVAQFFFSMVLRLDQVIVRAYAGYRELGLYVLATSAAELVWLLTEPLTAALVPHQLRARVGEDRRLGFAMTRLSLWISMAAAAIGWLLAPTAIRLAFGPEFVSAASALRLLLPGVVALAAVKPLRTSLLMEGRTTILILADLGALGLNVALNLLLLPMVGINGASIASSACYAAAAFVYVAATRKPGVAGWRDVVPRVSDLRLLNRDVLRGGVARGLGPD